MLLRGFRVKGMQRARFRHGITSLRLCHVLMAKLLASCVLAGDEPALEESKADDGPAREGFYLGPLRIGGALRTNYTYKDWDPDFKGAGELALDTARINLDLETSSFMGSFEYRYYRDKFADGHDYSMLHHGWLGWKFDDQHEVQVGVQRVPFGILPYASHNWFFQLPYYVGLEDDHDLGIKYIQKSEGWDLRVAYYRRDEGHYVGESDDSARYSYDLVREGDEGNRERDQVNLRLAHTFDHSEDFTTELGLSLQWGRVPNTNTSDNGHQWAEALHINGNYGRWNVMLQALRYEYHLKNSPSLDASPEGDFVTMGAFDSSYHVASKANIYTVGLAYKLPIDRWGIDSLTFYNDFSAMIKDASGFADSFQNVLGCGISAGRLYIYIDWAVGRNHPWIGGDYTDGLADGGRRTANGMAHTPECQRGILLLTPRVSAVVSVTVTG